MRLVSHALNGLPTVSVARPAKWGNPFALEDYPRPKALELFRRLVEQSEPGTQFHRDMIRRHLRARTWPATASPTRRAMPMCCSRSPVRRRRHE
jgi:hypothetical protein